VLVRLGPIQEVTDIEGVRRKICVFCSEKDHDAGDYFDVLHSHKGVVDGAGVECWLFLE
jgi:hypothetical protein